jgi:hypothetical protein
MGSGACASAPYCFGARVYGQWAMLWFGGHFMFVFLEEFLDIPWH